MLAQGLGLMRTHGRGHELYGGVAAVLVDLRGESHVDALPLTHAGLLHVVREENALEALPAQADAHAGMPPAADQAQAFEAHAADAQQRQKNKCRELQQFFDLLHQKPP